MTGKVLWSLVDYLINVKIWLCILHKMWEMTLVYLHFFGSTPFSCSKEQLLIMKSNLNVDLQNIACTVHQYCPLTLSYLDR